MKIDINNITEFTERLEISGEAIDPDLRNDIIEFLKNFYPRLRTKPDLYYDGKIKRFLNLTLEFNPYIPSGIFGEDNKKLFLPYTQRTPSRPQGYSFTNEVKKIAPEIRLAIYEPDIFAYKKYINENIDFYEPQARSSVHPPSYYFQKTLEHFTTYSQIGKKEYQSIMDVGTQGGAYTKMLLRNFPDKKIFTQDLKFPEGVRKMGGVYQVGGSAGKLPLPDYSIDFIVLHCAFEHFEGSADSEFISEASRVLTKNGTVIIIPFYTASRYHLKINPVVAFVDESFQKTVLEDEVKKNNACIEYQLKTNSRFGRFYDPESFYKRIFKNKGNLKISFVKPKSPSNIFEIDFHPSTYHDGKFTKFPTNTFDLTDYTFFRNQILCLDKGEYDFGFEI